jgi:hypothetical protein
MVLVLSTMTAGCVNPWRQYPDYGNCGGCFYDGYMEVSETIGISLMPSKSHHTENMTRAEVYLNYSDSAGIDNSWKYRFYKYKDEKDPDIRMFSFRTSDHYDYGNDIDISQGSWTDFTFSVEIVSPNRYLSSKAFFDGGNLLTGQMRQGADESMVEVELDFDYEGVNISVQESYPPRTSIDIDNKELSLNIILVNEERCLTCEG